MRRRIGLLVVTMLLAYGGMAGGQGTDQVDVDQILRNGSAALQKNQPDDAITMFKRALELDPRDGVTAIHLARAYSM